MNTPLKKADLEKMVFGPDVVFHLEDNRKVKIAGHEHSIAGIPEYWENATVLNAIEHAHEFVVVRKVQALLKRVCLDKDGKYLGDEVVKKAISDLRAKGLRVANFASRQKVDLPPEVQAARLASQAEDEAQLDALIAQLQAARAKRFAEVGR